jgi:DNA-binding NarL/FixJ family response regulator
MSEISLVVVDGQCTFADALASCLAAEDGLLVVATADSAAATRRLLVGRHVDIVLLGSELPEGLHLAAELARIRPNTPRPIRVIMLGTVPEATRVVAALRAGVTAWVSKDDSIEHLLDAIRCAMRDETWLPATLVGPVLRLLLHQNDQREASQKHPLASLTPREREVLSQLAEGLGRREVGERMHLSANTVRSHLQNLMGKLKVHSTLEAVAIARQARLSDALPGDPHHTQAT